MRLNKLLCFGTAALGVAAETSPSSSTSAPSSSSSSSSMSITLTENAGIASQTYISYSSTITLARNSSSGGGGGGGGAVGTTASLLQGTAATNSTSGASPSASQVLAPCNGYVELCNRNYSNVTVVGAHNSPFAIAHNAASNQEYGVVAQLNDGIRMLQGQTHLVDGVVHYCHTSCDLLDAGPAEDYFANVSRWLSNSKNRFEVVTILIGNGNYSDPSVFVDPIQNSGLGRFAYTPPKIPMGRDDWPTLAELILNDTRAVIFLDYKANQTQIPYLLDEFSQMWETPFDPLNNSFPCTVQRPPDLDHAAAEDRLFMLNNNLNVELQLLGTQILVPNVAALNTTNGVAGPGSLGASTNGCVADWSRPPNFLLVDYYNYGNFPGSVFEVAARANNVTFQPEDCCGLDQTVSAASAVLVGSQWLLFLLAVTMFLL